MDLMDDEKALKEMGERAASVAVPNAVKQIVDRLEELIKQN
jgi:UDP-N-acetylglucosamine:LPS N-acetylglucosamine transferase